jgi:hypothetical protein
MKGISMTKPVLNTLSIDLGSVYSIVSAAQMCLIKHGLMAKAMDLMQEVLMCTNPDEAVKAVSGFVSMRHISPQPTMWDLTNDDLDDDAYDTDESDDSEGDILH